MSEKKGLGIWCGLCDKYYPDIQKVEEHKLHTLSETHWQALQPSIKSDALADLKAKVEEKIARASKIQDERDALNKDTIVQDCKIDAWESVLALLDAEVGK